jgi:hypothetical protein
MNLPRGEIRDRYRYEFLAELPGLTRTQQSRHALTVLTHSWALRSAVKTHRSTPPLEVEMSQRTPSDPLLCRTNLHHRWVEQKNADGESYLRCSRCGKDRYDVEPPDGPRSGPNLVMGGG